MGYVFLIKMLPSSKLPKADDAGNVMEREDFKEYVATHGYHFTEKLAEWASKKMKNATGLKHTWSTDEVLTAYKGMGYVVPEGVTEGDMAYLANMGYADYYPTLLKNDGDCMKYVHATLDDPDGYQEVAFMRWIADLIGKQESVDWDEFI